MSLNLGFSFLAGILTSLSPCVLPILPMLFGGAIQKNRLAPLFMILGLATSFVVVGLLIGSLGHLIGLESEDLRLISVIVLILLGISLLSSKLQNLISEKMSGVSSQGSKWTYYFSEDSVGGALAIGLLLGVVWSPCVGPTLGVAISLASQTSELGNAFLIMLVFALGASIPMLGISYGLRSVVLRNRSKILTASQASKKIFGLLLIVVGLVLLFGVDKVIETHLLNILPEAWVDIITKY
jgi:cytochrome c-type biogenesis protein